MPTAARVLKRPAAAPDNAEARKRGRPAAAKPEASARTPRKSPARPPAKVAEKQPEPEEPKRDPRMVEVELGLQQASAAGDMLPAACQVLHDLASVALASAKDQRDKYLQESVQLIEDVFVTAEKRIQGRADAARRQTEEAHSAIGAKEREAESLCQEVEAQQTIVKEKTKDLAGAAEAFRSARAAVQDAEEAAAGAENSLAMDACQAATLEAALEQHFRPLVANGSAPAEAATADWDCSAAVEKLLKELRAARFDESILSALPAAVQKPPACRGVFDSMVLTQVQQEVANRREAAKTRADGAEAERAKRNAELHVLRATFQATKEHQAESASKFSEVHAEATRREHALQAAQEDLQSSVGVLKKGESDLSAATAELQALEDGPVNAFRSLRDQASTPKPENDGVQRCPQPDAVPLESSQETRDLVEEDSDSVFENKSQDLPREDGAIAAEFIGVAA